MRSCFALAIYASILKKKKSFLSFCQNPGWGGGGVGTPYACNGLHGGGPSHSITMIPFDKGGYSMRSCFALAIYASILKKKKKLFVLLPKPGGGGGGGGGGVGTP